jgi:hypothetical protein
MRNVLRRDLTNLSFLDRFVRTFVIFGIGMFVVDFFYMRATSDWLIQCLLSLVFAIWTSLLFTVSQHFVAQRYEGKNGRSKNDSCGRTSVK